MIERESGGNPLMLVTREDVLATEFGDEVVILSLHDGVYYGLDEVGASIWRLLREPVSIQAICDEIVGAYEVERSRCERDVRALLNDLVAKHLVRTQDGP